MYKIRWWWTGRPGMLRFMGSQRVEHDWANELNWKRFEKQLVQKAYSSSVPLKAEYKSPCGNTFPVPEVERHLYNQRGKCKAEMAVQGTSKPCYFTNLLPQVKTPCFVKSSHTQSCLPCHFLSLVSSIFARNSVRLDFCYCFVLGKFNC